MIVISGALVLVALILLVIGLVSASLAFVYASIGISVLSFVALIIGILQRRKEDQVAAAGEADVPATAALASTDTADDAAVAPVRRATSEAAVSGSVLVVAGRPRYHVAGCRYLTGKLPESVDVGRALEEGFTACGVCRPDDALAASSGTTGPEVSDAAADTTALELPAPEPVEEEATPARPRRTAVAPVTQAARVAPAKAASSRTAGKAPAKTATKAVTKTAAKAAPAAKAAKSPGKAPAKAATKAPAKTGAKAPVKQAAAKAPAKKAPAKKATGRR